VEISNVYFADEALLKILKGVDILSNAVKTTMGPSGGTVIIGLKTLVPAL
jgi:chaperonin GroEL (HSP60 family)